MNATVVVPTHNGRERLRRLLGSLAGTAGEVVVVDNGSSDGSADLAEELGAATIRLRENVGYARAVNVAARGAAGSTLVLLNDDCICEPGLVERLVGALDAADGVVMAAGVLLEPGGATIDTAGMELDETLLVFDYLNGAPVAVLDRPVADPVGPCAAAAAFDRDAFLSVGGFDERLFAYWEDVDLVLRLRTEGGRCRLVRDARGVHEHSATLGSGSRRKNYLTGFGRGYVLRKWRGAGLRTVAAAVQRDVPVLAGQAVLDRNLAGVRGRVDGWRVGASAPRVSAPSLPGAAARPRTLSRRYRRRARIRARRRAVA